MKKITLLHIALGCILSLSAQDTRYRDSILKLLQTAKYDSVKVILYLQLGAVYENNEPRTARRYIQQAMDLSKRIGHDKGTLRCCASYMSTFMEEGNWDSANYYNEQAFAIARKLKDSIEIGTCLFNKGIVYREQNDFDKALQYMLEGRAIIEKQDDKVLQMQLNDALGILYNERTEYDKAIPFGEKAVQLSRELKNKMLLAQSLVNLSMPYAGIKDLVKAEKAAKEALQIGEEEQDMRVQAAAIMNLGGIFLEKGDMINLRPYAQRSLALGRQIGSADGQSIALRALALTYLHEKNFPKAKELALEALEINRQHSFLKEQAATLRLLSAIYYATGDMDKGLLYDTEMNTLLEKMIKDVLSEQSANLEKKYETQKKENTIKQLQAERAVQQLRIRQKNTLNYILIGSALALLIVAFLIYRTYKQKQRLQQQRISELEKEKQLTATEAVLKGEEQERTRLAKDLHDGLGGMLSGIKYSLISMKGNLIMTPDNAQAFERSLDMLDSSIQEMRRVAHNMMPEVLVKFGLDPALKDFCNDIMETGALQVVYQSVGLEDATIDQTTAITVYRIVQELVNNILRHAGAKNAFVQVTKLKDAMTITVEDDGKGFDTAALRTAKGIGWSNIQNRVEFLKGKLDVESSPDKGTSVLIELPV